jgi:hypothetical protein
VDSVESIMMHGLANPKKEKCHVIIQTYRALMGHSDVDSSYKTKGGNYLADLPCISL